MIIMIIITIIIIIIIIIIIRLKLGKSPACTRRCLRGGFLLACLPVLESTCVLACVPVLSVYLPVCVSVRLSFET